MIKTTYIAGQCKINTNNLHVQENISLSTKKRGTAGKLYLLALQG